MLEQPKGEDVKEQNKNNKPLPDNKEVGELVNDLANHMMKFDFDPEFSQGLKQWYKLSQYIIDYLYSQPPAISDDVVKLK